MRAVARQAVRRFAGMEPGRPVGGTYYLYRTLRNLDLDGVLERLMEQAREEAPEPLTAARGAPRAGRVPRPASSSSRRRSRPRSAARLVADRGVEAMARTLRKPLPEDVDFMHASPRGDGVAAQGDLPAHPQARRAPGPQAPPRPQGPARLPQHGAPLAVSYGGVPAEPKFKYPRPSKPEIFVVADISGSVAAFARFTLHLVYAISDQFSKVRSFVFIDGLDEVTHFFEGVEDITEAVHRVNTEADVVWVDGHSDYGHAFEVFCQKYGKEVGPKTTVILLGDARNNYHASQSWVVKEIQQPGPPRLLAQPRAEVLLGHRRLDRRASTATTATASSSAATCASSRSSSTTWPEVGGFRTSGTARGATCATCAARRWPCTSKTAREATLGLTHVTRLNSCIGERDASSGTTVTDSTRRRRPLRSTERTRAVRRPWRGR